MPDPALPGRRPAEIYTGSPPGDRADKFVPAVIRDLHRNGIVPFQNKRHGFLIGGPQPKIDVSPTILAPKDFGDAYFNMADGLAYLRCEN